MGAHRYAGMILDTALKVQQFRSESTLVGRVLSVQNPHSSTSRRATGVHHGDQASKRQGWVWGVSLEGLRPRRTNESWMVKVGVVDDDIDQRAWIDLDRVDLLAYQVSLSMEPLGFVGSADHRRVAFDPSTH